MNLPDVLVSKFDSVAKWRKPEINVQPCERSFR
jgi:hypothetical protein